MIFSILLICIIIVLISKTIEKSGLSSFKNVKTGKVIPHYTIFQSFQNTLRRFYKGVSIQTIMKDNLLEKGGVFASFFFLSRPRIVVS